MKKKIYSPSVEALEEKITKFETYIEREEIFLGNWAKLMQGAYDAAEARLRVVTLDWNSMKAKSIDMIKRDKENIEVLKSTIKLLEEKK